MTRLVTDEDLTIAKVDDAAWPRQVMLVMVLALAQQHAELRGDLLDRAERLNVFGPFPYHLFRRAIDALRERP
jgi:hypothetical protein